jgi:hypothetical protein
VTNVGPQGRKTAVPKFGHFCGLPTCSLLSFLLLRRYHHHSAPGTRTHILSQFTWTWIPLLRGLFYTQTISGHDTTSVDNSLASRLLLYFLTATSHRGSQISNTMPPKAKTNHEDSKSETASVKNGHGAGNPQSSRKLQRVNSSTGSQLREPTTVNGPSSTVTQTTTAPPGVSRSTRSMRSYFSH